MAGDGRARGMGRLRAPGSLFRALALAAVGGLAGGLNAAGTLRGADFEVGFHDELPRSVAFLFLALARVGRLRVLPGHLDALSRLLPPGEFFRVALRSPRRSRGPRPRYTVTDDPGRGSPGTEGRVLIDYDYFNPERPPGTLVAPFFLHPHYYARRLDRTLPELRNGPRNTRLFFAGTADPAAYTRSFAAGLFPVMNRTEVLAAVRQDFPAEVLRVQGRAELRRIPESGRPIVLVLTDRTEDTLTKHLLQPREYLRLLAGSAFALCPPGWIMPHSHNLVEALAVGTVPVLSYASVCEPPLTDGVNCLGFRDRDELRTAVRRVLSLPEADARGMGRAAADYYDREHTVDAFANRLSRALTGGDVRVRFNRGEKSVLLGTRRLAGRAPGADPRAAEC